MSSVFTDPAAPPGPDAIRAALGSAVDAWEAVTALFAEAGVEVGWRHYRDGGWLAKATHRGRTVAWISVEGGHFRVSFHVAERLRGSILRDPTLPTTVRTLIDRTPPSGRLLSIPLDVRSLGDVDDVRALLPIKLAAK